MKIYKVKIKNNTRAETIKASSELEAKVKYCKKNGLKYSLFASKLELVRQDRRDKTGLLKKRIDIF